MAAVCKIKQSNIKPWLAIKRSGAKARILDISIVPPRGMLRRHRGLQQTFNRTFLKQKHMIECIVHPGNWSKRGTECEECVLVRECDERQEKKAGTKIKKELDEEEHRKWLEDTARGRREDKAKWEEKEKDADGQPVAAQAAGVEAIPPKSMVIQDLAMNEEDDEEE